MLRIKVIENWIEKKLVEGYDLNELREYLRKYAISSEEFSEALENLELDVEKSVVSNIVVMRYLLLAVNALLFGIVVCGLVIYLMQL